MSNLVSQLMSSPDAPTNWTPNKVGIPLFASQDAGKFVKAMLFKHDQVLGKQVLAATKYVSPVDIAPGFMSVKKEAKLEVVQVSLERYKQDLPEAIRDEMGEDMALLGTHGYYAWKPLEWSLGLLDEKPTTWESEYVAQEEAWAELKFGGDFVGSVGIFDLPWKNNPNSVAIWKPKVNGNEEKKRQ